MPEKSGTLESKPELELILLIVSPDPQSTALRVASLSAIGEYRLVAEPTKTLHDIYLDTPDHLLSKKRVNLRVRGTGESYWITMKISPGLLSWRRHERQEVEVPWSLESLSQIAGELSRKGVSLTVPSELDETLSHVEMMKLMGLRVLQDRETERRPRNIVEGGGPTEVLAELEVDSVLYHFAGQDVRLFELELEAKSQRGSKILGGLSRKLQADFGSELRSWRFGKLVTGEKIERLLERKELGAYLDGSTLKAGGYERIERA